MRPHSITEIARRTVKEEQAFDISVRGFLDEWQRLDTDKRSEALRQEPSHVGRIHTDRLEIPAWTDKPSRFLDEPFFSGGLESLKLVLLVESPLAFRRRLIFINANALAQPRRASVEALVS